MHSSPITYQAHRLQLVTVGVKRFDACRNCSHLLEIAAFYWQYRLMKSMLLYKDDLAQMGPDYFAVLVALPLDGGRAS